MQRGRGGVLQDAVSRQRGQEAHVRGKIVIKFLSTPSLFIHFPPSFLFLVPKISVATLKLWCSSRLSRAALLFYPSRSGFINFEKCHALEL